MVTPRRCVLVVDDDDPVREVAQLTLELVGGWEVLTAPDGPTALAVARSHRLDAVLLDVMMPGMDGLDVVHRLRGDVRTASLPVVLLTAKATTGQEPEWRDVDVSGVIAKPFDPMALAGRVRELLGWDDES